MFFLLKSIFWVIKQLTVNTNTRAVKKNTLPKKRPFFETSGVVAQVHFLEMYLNYFPSLLKKLESYMFFAVEPQFTSKTKTRREKKH